MPHIEETSDVGTVLRAKRNDHMLGVRFKAARIAAGYLNGDQRLDLAKTAKVQAELLAQIERGKAKPSAEELERIDLACRVPPGYLAGMVDYAGNSLEDESLSLPPWMLYLKGELIFDRHLIEHNLQVVPVDERNKWLSKWMGGEGAGWSPIEVSRLLAGRRLPSRVDLKRLKDGLVTDFKLEPEDVLPFIEHYQGHKERIVRTEIVHKEDYQIAEDILAGLPEYWQAAVAELQPYILQGKLRVGKKGSFWMLDFLVNANLEIRQRGKTIQWLTTTLAATYPKLSWSSSTISQYIGGRRGPKTMPADVMFAVAETLAVPVIRLLGLEPLTANPPTPEPVMASVLENLAEAVKQPENVPLPVETPAKEKLKLAPVTPKVEVVPEPKVEPVAVETVVPEAAQPDMPTEVEAKPVPEASPPPAVPKGPLAELAEMRAQLVKLEEILPTWPEPQRKAMVSWIEALAGFKHSENLLTLWQLVEVTWYSSSALDDMLLHGKAVLAEDKQQATIEDLGAEAFTTSLLRVTPSSEQWKAIGAEMMMVHAKWPVLSRRDRHVLFTVIDWLDSFERMAGFVEASRLFFHHCQLVAKLDAYEQRYPALRRGN